jgi:hypothetical protein
VGEHMSAGSAVLSVGHAFSSVDLAKVSALMTSPPCSHPGNSDQKFPATCHPLLVQEPRRHKEGYDHEILSSRLGRKIRVFCDVTQCSLICWRNLLSESSGQKRKL